MELVSWCFWWLFEVWWSLHSLQGVTENYTVFLAGHQKWYSPRIAVQCEFPSQLSKEKFECSSSENSNMRNTSPQNRQRCNVKNSPKWQWIPLTLPLLHLLLPQTATRSQLMSRRPSSHQNDRFVNILGRQELVLDRFWRRLSEVWRYFPLIQESAFHIYVVQILAGYDMLTTSHWIQWSTHTRNIVFPFFPAVPSDPGKINGWGCRIWME